MQRTGRAGRMSEGKCYRLYTEEDYEELAQSAVPEIKRCRLSSMVLQLKVLLRPNCSSIPAQIS